jgi:LacI family transcriptional regulator
VSIPGEVSPMGFDDLEWTRLVGPELTVVSQPVLEMGCNAAADLLHRIEGVKDSFRTTFAETRIVERTTTATPLPHSSDAGSRAIGYGWFISRRLPRAPAGPA